MRELNIGGGGAVTSENAKVPSAAGRKSIYLPPTFQESVDQQSASRGRTASEREGIDLFGGQ